MNYAKYEKERLWTLIESISNDSKKFLVNPETDFSRKKKWDLPSIMKFMIYMEGNSVNSELLKTFDFSSDCPSNSSFNQRRAQILPDAFEYLFNAYTSDFLKTVYSKNKYQFIACDGSDINISRNQTDKDTFSAHIQQIKALTRFILMHFTILRKKYT